MTVFETSLFIIVTLLNVHYLRFIQNCPFNFWAKLEKTVSLESTHYFQTNSCFCV